MADIKLSGRLIAKHGTTEEWENHLGFVPMRGEIIVYEDRETYQNGDTATVVAGIKIGDGNAYLVDLPFVDEALTNRILEHEDNTKIHVSVEDREKWDNKLNYDVDSSSENLIFNRL